MALIPCPDCNAQISETAEHCPRCGFKLTQEVVKSIQERERQKQEAEVERARANWIIDRILLVVCACLVLGVAFFFMLPFEKSSHPSSHYSGTTNNSDDDKFGAIVAAKGFVTRQLKSPASASFPWGDCSATHLGGGEWRVCSYVDSQNSFGAKIRNSWTAVVLKEPGQWRLVRLTFED